MPRLRRASSARGTQVVFERTTPARAAGAWRLVEFEKLEDLDAALAAAAAEGFRPRLLVRPPFRSWPGLSERGLVLAAGAAGRRRPESRVLVGTKRDLKDVAPPLTTATADGMDGWT